jgi:3'-phosphoadenosine 5'-phosphosulfate sulfotransferase (PAPS reductase)/FAD synthetase
MATACAPQTLVRIRRAGRVDRGVETNATVDALLAADAPVVFAVSGGKDSIAGAIAMFRHLDVIGHRGPRKLIHADLGDEDPAFDVEWADSISTCERLAVFLGVELVIARRAAGGMMKRWLKRQENSIRRYANLECVKVILPWSTPSMRFCTSELKSAPMAARLVEMFPGTTIISACGVRRDESKNREDTATTAANPRLTSKKHRTTGIDWNPIAAWSEDDVFAYVAAQGFEMHEAYTKWNMSRVSCRFCIMQNEDDMASSASNPDHHPLLANMAGLEIRSTFGFQGTKWLADRAVQLGLVEGALVAKAKRRAEQRRLIEARIPKHLLYTKGWPTVMPTLEEAMLLSEVRKSVAALLGIEIKYAEPEAILARYAELMAIKAVKDARKNKRSSRGRS